MIDFIGLNAISFIFCLCYNFCYATILEATFIDSSIPPSSLTLAASQIVEQLTSQLSSGAEAKLLASYSTWTLLG